MNSRKGRTPQTLLPAIIEISDSDATWLDDQLLFGGAAVYMLRLIRWEMRWLNKS